MSEQIATASIGVRIDLEKAWKKVERDLLKQANVTSKKLTSILSEKGASKGKQAQSGFGKMSSHVQKLRKELPVVSNMLSTMQDQMRGVGRTSSKTFAGMVLGIKTVRTEGAALSLMFSTLQDQVQGVGKKLTGALSGSGTALRKRATAVIGSSPGSASSSVATGASRNGQAAVVSATGLATVAKRAPATISLLGKMRGQISGLGSEATLFGSAFGKVLGNLERRFPKLGKLGDQVRESLSSAHTKGSAALAKHVTPRIRRGRALAGDVRDIAGFAGGALRKRGGQALGSMRSGVVDALSPATQKIQAGAELASKHLKALSIQGQRVGRSMARDFQPLTQAFGRLGSQASQKLFQPLKQAAGTAVATIGQQLGKAFNAQTIGRFQTAVRGVAGLLTSVGRRAVSSGVQITKNFFGAAFRRSLGMASLALRGIRGSISMVGRGLRGMAATMRSTLLPLAALAGGLSILAGGVLSVKTFATFEQSMARVKALTSANAKEFAGLTRLAEELGATTQFSASQASEAMGNFAQAGFKVKEIMGAAGPTLNLAAAGQLDMGTASDITAKVMRGMQLEVTELTHVTDVLTKAFTTANTDLVMLGEAMKYVGPVAQISGKSLEETVAALQALSDAGVQSSMAGTGLRGLLSRMAQEGSDVEKVFGSLNVAIKEQSGALRPLADIVDDFNRAVAAQGKETEVTAMAMSAFGERAGPAFAVLLGKGGDALRKYEAALHGAGGTAERIAKTQMDTLMGSFTMMKSAAEGAMITFGRALAPALRGLADTMTDLLPTLGGVAAEIKPLADAVGQALSGRIRALTSFLAENKGEFSSWFSLMSEIFNNVTNLVGSATEGIANFVSKIFGFQTGVRGIADAAVAGITNLLDAISLITTDPGGFAMAMGETLLGSLKLGAASLLDALKVGITSFASTISMTFNAAIAAFEQVFTGVIHNFPKAISAGIVMGTPSILGGDLQGGMKQADDAKRNMALAMIAARNAARGSIANDMAAGDSSFTRFANGLVDPLIASLRGSASTNFSSAARRGEAAGQQREDQRNEAASQAEAQRHSDDMMKELVDYFNQERAQRHAIGGAFGMSGMFTKGLATISATVAQQIGPAQAGMFGGNGMARNLGDMVAGAAEAAREFIFGDKGGKVINLKGGRQSDTMSMLNEIQSSLFKDKSEEEMLRNNREIKTSNKGILEVLQEMKRDPKIIVAKFAR